MSKNLDDLKVAIVCDWLTGIGGAERVVLELHKIFPSAPIYTSQYNPDKLDWFENADVRTGWLQSIPSSLKKFLPVFRVFYFSRLDLSEYDIVISETGAEAKGIKFGDKTKHICICNAPTHYYWSRYEQYIKEPGFGKLNWLARLGLKILVNPLRNWDHKAAQKPTQIIAISSHIHSEIKQYYNRDSFVIFPPVDIDRFSKVPKQKRSGFIITGRQTPYKRIDLAVEACTKLNLPLKVVGNGPEHEKLKALAGPTIKFITDADDKKVADLLSGSEGFIFPGLDDFGISPVEALACGTPVIAYQAGGALDYIVPGIAGEFFNEQTVDKLSDVLSKFDYRKYDEDNIKEFASKFSKINFKNNLINYLEKIVN